MFLKQSIFKLNVVITVCRKYIYCLIIELAAKRNKVIITLLYVQYVVFFPSQNIPLVKVKRPLAFNPFRGFPINQMTNRCVSQIVI